MNELEKQRTKFGVGLFYESTPYGIVPKDAKDDDLDLDLSFRYAGKPGEILKVEDLSTDHLPKASAAGKVEVGLRIYRDMKDYEELVGTGYLGRNIDEHLVHPKWMSCSSNNPLVILTLVPVKTGGEEMRLVPRTVFVPATEAKILQAQKKAEAKIKEGKPEPAPDFKKIPEIQFQCYRLEESNSDMWLGRNFTKNNPFTLLEGEMDDKEARKAAKDLREPSLKRDYPKQDSIPAALNVLIDALGARNTEEVPGDIDKIVEKIERYQSVLKEHGKTEQAAKASVWGKNSSSEVAEKVFSEVDPEDEWCKGYKATQEATKVTVGEFVYGILQGLQDLLAQIRNDPDRKSIPELQAYRQVIQNGKLSVMLWLPEWADGFDLSGWNADKDSEWATRWNTLRLHFLEHAKEANGAVIGSTLDGEPCSVEYLQSLDSFGFMELSGLGRPHIGGINQATQNRTVRGLAGGRLTPYSPDALRKARAGWEFLGGKKAVPCNLSRTKGSYLLLADKNSNDGKTLTVYWVSLSPELKEHLKELNLKGDEDLRQKIKSLIADLGQKGVEIQCPKNASVDVTAGDDDEDEGGDGNCDESFDLDDESFDLDDESLPTEDDESLPTDEDANEGFRIVRDSFAQQTSLFEPTERVGKGGVLFRAAPSAEPCDAEDDMGKTLESLQGQVEEIAKRMAQAMNRLTEDEKQVGSTERACNNLAYRLQDLALVKDGLRLESASIRQISTAEWDVPYDGSGRVLNLRTLMQAMERWTRCAKGCAIGDNKKDYGGRRHGKGRVAAAGNLHRLPSAMTLSCLLHSDYVLDTSGKGCGPRVRIPKWSHAYNRRSYAKLMRDADLILLGDDPRKSFEILGGFLNRLSNLCARWLDESDTFRVRKGQAAEEARRKGRVTIGAGEAGDFFKADAHIERSLFLTKLLASGDASGPPDRIRNEACELGAVIGTALWRVRNLEQLRSEISGGQGKSTKIKPAYFEQPKTVGRYSLLNLTLKMQESNVSDGLRISSATKGLVEKLTRKRREGGGLEEKERSMLREYTCLQADLHEIRTRFDLLKNQAPNACCKLQVESLHPMIRQQILYHLICGENAGSFREVRKERYDNLFRQYLTDLDKTGKRGIPELDFAEAPFPSEAPTV